MIRNDKKSRTSRTAAELLSRAFSGSADATLIFGDLERIVAANAAASRMFGYSVTEFQNLQARGLYGVEEDWNAVCAALMVAGIKDTAPLAVTLRHKSGTLFDSHVRTAAITGDDGLHIGFTQVFTLDAAGVTAGPPGHLVMGTAASMRLARGFAHDLNNLLAVIGGNIQLAIARTSEPKVRAFLKDAELACQMGARLTDTIKTFAADRHYTATTIEIPLLLQSQLPVFKSTLGEKIEIALNIEPGVGSVLADLSALENALVNLVFNARDAMPDGGRIVITAKLTNGGKRIVIAVADTGTGMTPRVRARAFDPFFTTKAPGRGTGLGLASVYGFVQQSGGDVTLVSAPDEGTTVSIELPCLPKGAVSP